MNRKLRCHLVLAMFTAAVAGATESQVWLAPLINSQPVTQWFEPASTWSRILPRVQVLVVDAAWVNAVAPSELAELASTIQRYPISLALRASLFNSDKECAAQALDYLTTLNAARKLAPVAPLRYIELDRPFSSRSGCGWSRETLVASIGMALREIKAEAPGAEIGILETIWDSGISDAIRDVGPHFSFFHAQPDWAGPSWNRAAASDLVAFAKALDLILGMVYSGSEKQIEDFELNIQVPEHAVFDRKAENADSPGDSHLTDWLNRYLRVRTSITISANGFAINGALTSGMNQPVPNAPVAVSISTQQGRGQPSNFRISGAVPNGANGIVFGVRVNSECGNACRGPGHLSVLKFAYRDEKNAIEHDFAASGLRGWSDISAPALRSLSRFQRGELAIDAEPGQAILWNGSSRLLAQGATTFEFTVLARVSSLTSNSGQFVVIFIGEGMRETSRAGISLRPSGAMHLVASNTSETGDWTARTPWLEDDLVAVTAEFPGSASHWPARASTTFQSSRDLAAPYDLRSYRMGTVAGRSPAYHVGDAKTFVDRPRGITFDSRGNYYVSGAHCVFRVDRNGAVTRVAGRYLPGFSGDGGPATEASLNSPAGLAADTMGNLYIADHFNGRVRKVATDGRISTVAGNGAIGSTGDGGMATQAALSPFALALDPAGNLTSAPDRPCEESLPRG